VFTPVLVSYNKKTNGNSKEMPDYRNNGTMVEGVFTTGRKI